MAGRKWPDFQVRFWARVQKSSEAGGCWIWTGNRTRRGYGITYKEGRQHREQAHRISYRMENGDFPSYLLVCHKCDNPPCVRPDHLFLGSAKDNANDASRKGRLPSGEKHWRYLRPELTKRGYKRPEIESKGSKNPNAKLTEGDVLQIRGMRMNGAEFVDLAKMFNVSSDSIRLICAMKSWKHVH